MSFDIFSLLEDGSAFEVDHDQFRIGTFAEQLITSFCRWRQDDFSHRAEKLRNQFTTPLLQEQSVEIENEIAASRPLRLNNRCCLF
jgi:hypothetical protein